MAPLYVFLTFIGLGFLAAKDKLGVFVSGLGYLTAAIAILMVISVGCFYLYTEMIKDLIAWSLQVF